MSEGIGYALGAMLLYGVADFVYKRGAAAGAEPHQFLMVQTWFFSSFAILYGFFSGALVLNRGALWGAAAGVLVVIGYYNFARSLKSGAVSTHATIFRMSFAVTVALAVLVLGEPLTAPKLAGLALALVAVWLLLAAPGAAALLVVACTFLAKGLEGGEASVVVPVAQMGFVVTALLGFLFLREPFTARRCAGFAAALAALASLARG